MKHGGKIKKFHRETDQRRALMRSLARALILHESITTTEAKAKALRPFIEPLVTRAKDNTLANRRLVESRLGKSDVASKLFNTIAPRYMDRTGGYTRVVKVAPKAGRGKREAVIAFV
jgi:large subunit ribosomal protein L17